MSEAVAWGRGGVLPLLKNWVGIVQKMVTNCIVHNLFCLFFVVIVRFSVGFFSNPPTYFLLNIPCLNPVFPVLPFSVFFPNPLWRGSEWTAACWIKPQSTTQDMASATRTSLQGTCPFALYVDIYADKIVQQVRHPVKEIRNWPVVHL